MTNEMTDEEMAEAESVLPEVLKAGERAVYLRVTPAAVYRLVAAGETSVTKIDRGQHFARALLSE